MCWGCIGPNGVGKQHLYTEMNATKYVSLQQENLPQRIFTIYGDENRPFIFQQDNAPSHRANIIKSHLDHEGINILPWPQQSSDLNIIENVWQFMKNKLNYDPRGLPRTREALIERI